MASTDQIYALLKFHNGFPLYSVVRKSNIRCIDNCIIRYRGCFYDASVILNGSKQYCELCLSIIQNQPSVVIEKSMEFNVKSHSEETIQIEEVMKPGYKNNEVERPTTSTQSISTELKIFDAVLMNMTGKENPDATHNQQITDVLTDITNQSDIIKGNKVKDPNEAIDDKNSTVSVSTDGDLLQWDDEEFEMSLLNYSTSDDEYDNYISIYEHKQKSQLSEPSEELGKRGVSDIYVNDGDSHATTAKSLEMSSRDTFSTPSELEKITGSDMNLHEIQSSNNTTITPPRLQNYASDLCLSDEEHHSDYLEMSSRDTSSTPAELENITVSDMNLHETQSSNNATFTPPRLQNYASDICLSDEEHHSDYLEMSSQNNSISTSELGEIVDSDLHSLAAAEATDNICLRNLYTETSEEMSSTSYEPYVATTLTNIPTPADIRLAATKYASFEGNLCSRSSLVAKKILSPEDKSKYWRLKYHFCIFCKKRVTRFARHLINVHKNEPEVMRINGLPAKCSTRLNILENLRNRGMLMYNLDDRYNAGDTIVVRRPAKETKENSVLSYIPCSNCGGNFRKRNITRHYRKCTAATEAKGATMASLLLGKPILKAYFENVSTLMAKGKIDILAQICVQDTAILLYGSKLVSDLESEIHRDNDIRSKLRQMAQLLIEIKKLDTSVKELMDAFVPSKIKVVELAIKKVCEYDAALREYKKPSLAMHITTLIRKCVHSSITFMIESELPERRIQMESFLHLLRGNLVGVARSGVNKLQQNKMTTAKKVPLASDINKLNTYLKNQAADAYKILQNGFNETAWNTLSDCSLLLLMIFNRKRTGESQRILVANYNSKRPINEDSDIYKTLDEDQQQICKQFARMEILGKWRRTVVMLFPPLFITYIDTILKYREQAGVSNENRYLFGTKIGTRSHRFANAALSNAAIKCGAINPASLRGTNLRKHIATITQMVNMTDSDIKLLSSFMGHDQSIHETSYRQTDSTLQIAKLTKLLMAFNEGSLEKIKGKTLDEIEMDSDLLTDTTKNKENLSKKTAAKMPVKRIRSISDSETDSDTFASDADFVAKQPKKVTFTRKRWTENELKELDKNFGRFYASNQSPSLNAIEAIRRECTYLKGRTKQQINAQISNKKKNR